MPITFYQTIHHGTNRQHTAPPPPRHRPSYPPGLAIRTLNIRDGRGFGLAQAIRALELSGFDLMLLTDTNPDGGVLTQQAELRRDMLCCVPINHQGSAWLNWLGVARPAHCVGDQFHTLPRDERGDL